MAKGTTLAAVAAEVAGIKAMLEERERENAETEKRVVELLRNRGWTPETRPDLRLVHGSAKRRTGRRGVLEVVR